MLRLWLRISGVMVTWCWGTPANITDICVYRNMRYRFETNEVVEDRLNSGV